MGDNKEAVNHPYHYTESSIECIDAMRMTFGTEYVIMWSIMTAYKYLWRRNNKENPTEDMKKARWYLDYAFNTAIEHYGSMNNADPDISVNFNEVNNYFLRVFKQ